MAKRNVQHIGDDQLVYGLPKHMVGSPSQKNAKRENSPGSRDSPDKPDTQVFWTVHPKNKACDACKAMEGIKFAEEPERPHPNCKCEIRRHEHTPGKRRLGGFIKGYDGNAVEQFFGLGLVRVTIRHVTGALGSGVHVYSNLDGVRQGHTLGKEVVFTFGALTDTPILWNIHIVQKGADNTLVKYEIEYEQ